MPSDEDAVVTDSGADETARTPEIATQPKVKLRQSRSKEFPAWAGTREDLLLIYDRAATAVERQRQRESTTVEGLPAWYQAQAAQDLTVQARAGGAGNLERTGDLRSVLDAMDVREVSFVDIGNTGILSRSGSSIHVEMGMSKHIGASLSVSGSDPDWVSGTYESLVGPLARGVPRWAFVFSDPFDITIALVIPIFIVWCVLVFSFRVQPTVKPSVSTVGFLFVAILAIVLGLWTSVRRRFFRRFELLGPGQKSSGGRVGTLLASSIGLVAALLTIWTIFGG